MATLSSKNELAPINVKLEILDSCVTAALVYGCESWGGESTGKLESIYHMGLKRALSIRVTTNDDITYIDAGRFPLLMTIRKQQLKFWNTLMSQVERDPTTLLAKLIAHAERLNL